MADVNSGLPVRSQLPGQVAYDDIIVKIGDGTLPSQLLAVDSAGLIGSKLYDGAGTAITSQANGAQQALDVGINVAGVQIDPRQIRALTAADVVTANQGSANTNANAWFMRLTDGTNDSILLATGELTVAVTQPLPAGANNIGSVNQGTSPWIVKDQADGPVTPGAVAAFSQLAGGQYNAVLPTLTTGQQSAIQLDSSGRILVATTSLEDHNYGVVGANTLRSAAQIGNATGAADFNFGAAGAQTLRVAALIGNATGSADFNYGVVGAQTIRVASQIGNATGAADYNNGATGAQTLRVAANLAIAGADVTILNPVPVVVTDATPGTPINDYKRAIGVAAGASDSHDYTVTAAKTFYLNQVESTGSGKAKMEVEIETGVATGVFLTRWAKFNSTSSPDMILHIDNPIAVAAGVRVRVVMTNKDLLAADLYSTISGYELP